MSDIHFPRLTDDQCTQVLAWVEERLRPLADVLAELERPEVLDYLDSIGADRLTQKVKDRAASAVLTVGGGNGGVSWKSDPTFVDVDLFFLISTSADLLPKEASQLRAVLYRRCADEELLSQRDRCTIEGIAMAEGRTIRRFDFPKVGVLHNGVIWSVPSRCHHCGVHFEDAQFCAHDGVITHESCLGA